METIEWSNKYNLNVPEIDKEHKEFFKTINKAINVAKQHDIDKEEISVVLYELTMYALSHFRTEEKYMEETKYEGAKLHYEEHKDFVMKTVDLCNRTVRGDYNIIKDLLEHLKQWLTHHIQKTDRKLANFLIKKDD